MERPRVEVGLITILGSQCLVKQQTTRRIYGIGLFWEWTGT